MSAQELERHLACLRHMDTAGRGDYLRELEHAQGATARAEVLQAFSAEWRERRAIEAAVATGVLPC